MAALISLSELLWSPPILLLFGGVALFLTLYLSGLQFTRLPYALRLAFGPGARKSEGGAGELTQFQALMTSLAGAIGTGNIAGVATAIMAGGFGAVFWMWVIAALGMILRYSESLLAVAYRERNSRGEMSGGPMLYMQKGLGWPKLAAAFAVSGILSALVTGNMVQVNSVAMALRSATGLPLWVSGVGLALTTSLVLLGGVRSIGRVAEVFVPIMAGLYLLGGLVALLGNLSALGGVLQLILDGAFQGQAAAGGFMGATVGAAMRAGVARGVFSSEAGLGISSIASAAAITKHPVRQALIAMTSSFLSTLVICTMTACIIGVSGVVGDVDPVTGQAFNGAPLALQAFATTVPLGDYVVTFGLVFFAYSTILGWAYYGEKCLEFLLGVRSVRLYRILFVFCMPPAAVVSLQSVWALADVTNALMAIPNLLALFFLRGKIRQLTQEYTDPV